MFLKWLVHVSKPNWELGPGLVVKTKSKGKGRASRNFMQTPKHTNVVNLSDCELTPAM